MPRDRGRSRRAGAPDSGAARIARVTFSAEALDHIKALRQHYAARERPEAARNLARAIAEASQAVAAGQGVPAPRAYRALAEPGRAWVHAGRYWFRYSTTTPPVVLGVYYETSDIPRRL